jgi:hypothetical protein
MSDRRSEPASELMLLREVVRRPGDYGLDHRHVCLTSVVDFSTRNPRCVRDSEARARRKIERCLEGSRFRPSDPRPIECRIRRKLLQVKQDLAWTELDHLLGIDSRYWNDDRYARLAKSLCVLAVLWRYRRQRFPQAPGYASGAAAARLAQLWQLQQNNQ